MMPLEFGFPLKAVTESLSPPSEPIRAGPCGVVVSWVSWVLGCLAGEDDLSFRIPLREAASVSDQTVKHPPSQCGSAGAVALALVPCFSWTGAGVGEGPARANTYQ